MQKKFIKFIENTCRIVNIIGLCFLLKHNATFSVYFHWICSEQNEILHDDRCDYSIRFLVEDKISHKSLPIFCKNRLNAKKTKEWKWRLDDSPFLCAVCNFLRGKYKSSHKSKNLSSFKLSLSIFVFR